MNARIAVVLCYVTVVISAIDFMFAQENGENGKNYTIRRPDVVVNIVSSLKNEWLKQKNIRIDSIIPDFWFITDFWFMPDF